MKPLKDYLLKLSKSFQETVFPVGITCDCCSKDLFVEKIPAICDACFNTLPFIHNPCKKCGKEIEKDICYHCTQNTYSFKKAYAVFRYEKPISKMIYSFKYNKEFHLVNFFTQFLYWKFSSLTITPDCIVGIPMHPDKELKRVKNQATLLADALSKKTSIYDASSKIAKIAQTTQTSLDATQRLVNVKNSLVVLDPDFFKNKTILVIDDILTTGATANAIADTLYKCNAKRVDILTICTA